MANVSTSSINNIINFPSKEDLNNYIHSYDNPSFMMEFMLRNWDHFYTGGHFL